MQWDRVTLKAFAGVAAVIISGVVLLAGVRPVVAVGQFLQRSALRAVWWPSFHWAGVREGEGSRPTCFPWTLVRLRSSAVRVWIWQERRHKWTT
jgi:hypothetical protein